MPRPGCGRGVQPGGGMGVDDAYFRAPREGTPVDVEIGRGIGETMHLCGVIAMQKLASRGRQGDEAAVAVGVGDREELSGAGDRRKGVGSLPTEPEGARRSDGEGGGRIGEALAGVVAVHRPRIEAQPSDLHSVVGMSYGRWRRHRRQQGEGAEHGGETTH